MTRIMRLAVLSFVLVVLAMGGATQAFGIAEFYTQPCTTTAAVGSQFSILINLRNNVDSVFAWQYLLTWDSLLLRCDSVVRGPFLNRGQYTTYFVKNISVPGRALVVETMFGGVDPCAYGDGNLARMVFTVRDQGNTTLHFSDTVQTVLLNRNLQRIPLAVRDGYFQTPSGVEANTEVRSQRFEVRFKATPNPFTSFTTVPGHEGERFALYDVSGRKVGTYRGERIGEGLGPGVYFLKPEDKAGRPVRVVKLR